VIAGGQSLVPMLAFGSPRPVTSSMSAAFRNLRRLSSIPAVIVVHAGCYSGVARHAGRNLPEQLQPFCANPIFKRGKAPNVAAGRAKLETNPTPTGSETFANTIRTLRVARCKGPTAALPDVKITSRVSATSSAAYLRVSSSLPPDQRSI